MNYRHAFHAGNQADVLKHAVLLFCLEYLTRKPAAFAVLDTHAGTGLYDLWGEQGRRSPEWQGGIARVMDWPEAPPALSPLIEAVRAQNPDGALRFYPGSPLLIRGALRAQDRLLACELHADDAAMLKTRFPDDAQTQLHVRDGWAALTALLPFRERRGLVLIDPPYEEDGELRRAARAIGEAAQRFAGGVFLWWRPLKDARALEAADAELRFHLKALPTAPDTLRADLAVAAPTREGKLTASSLMLVNPPYGLAATLRALMPALTARLALGAGAAWLVKDRP